MKMGKRFVVLLLALALVLPFVIGAVPAHAASGEVTRAEWISRVVETFDMTVDDTSTMPDNYYSDLTTDNPYYQDILLAVEFGLIDIEAGHPFRPGDPATREFAAHTLNFALGFQLDENSDYTFSESSSVTYPNDIQVAINRGWFSLSGGSFMPEQPITASEADNMLADAAQVLAGDMAGGGDNTVEFAEGVIVVPQGKEVIWDSESNTVTIIGYDGTIAAGDIFAVYFDDYPMTFKAVSVTSSGDNSITVATTFDGTENAITSISYEGSQRADLESFEAAPTANYYITDTTQQNAQPQLLSVQTRDIHYDKNTKTLTASLKITVDRATAGSISVVLRNCYLDQKEVGGFLGIGAEYYKAILNADAEVTCALTFDFADYAGIPKSLTVGRVPILMGLCHIDLNVDFNVSGGLSLSWTGDINAGFEYRENDSFRLVSNFHKDKFSFVADFEMRTGLSIVAELNLAVIKGSIRVSAGVSMSFRAEYYDAGSPTTCIDLKGYFYLDGYMYISLFGKGLSWDKSFVIYDWRNSPLRVSYHIEDNVNVSRCTRNDEDYPYYTSPGSPYFSIGPNYDQSYEDGSGAVVQIYSYKVEEDDAGQKYAVITGYNGGASALAIPSEIDGYEVREIGISAFASSGVRSVVIPDNVTTIGRQAFYNCQSLSNVKLSSNLQELSYRSFGGCTSLKEIYIPKSLNEINITYGSSTAGPFANSGLTTVTFEEGMANVPGGLFYGADELQNVTLLDSMTVIGGSAFHSCTSLESIELPANITSINASAFNSCTSLSSIIIPDSVTTIGRQAFYNCASLKSVTLSSKITSIEERTFSGCASLEYIYLPDEITLIDDYAFFNTSNLTDVSLPASLKRLNTNSFNGSGLVRITIPGSCTTIESSAFANCSDLQDIMIAESVTSIEYGAFQNCDVITSIIIPNSVEEIGSSIFSGCETLANVTLGNGITEIPTNAFSNCPALNNVVIPYSVTEIGSSAFANCTGLTSITIPRTVTSIETNAFSYKDRMTIYGVPGTYAETFANTNGFTFVPQENAATSVALNVTELTINDNQEYQLTLTIEPPNFTDAIDWKSSNTEIVTVTQDGLIEGRSIGTATIKVTVGNQSASCKVTVVQPVTSISLNKTSLSLDALETYQLTATAKPSDAYNTKVIWSSSAPEIASVDENGLVTAHKKGTSTITATADDGNGAKRNCTVTVSNNAHVAYSTAQLESSHPYEANCKDVWVLTAEGASYIEVTFDSKTYFEDDFDFVYVYGTGDEPDESNKYTGASLAGQTVRVYGDVIKIKLETDNGGNEWGFKVTDLKTDGKLDPYAEIRAELSSAAALDTDSAKLDAVRELDIDLLAEAMAAEDSQIAGQLAELESGMSLTSDVIVTDSMRGHFTEDDIAVTGAVMNVQNTSSPVTLTIDAPHEADNYADSQYSSAVEFSMTLGNAIEPLEVPVMVTLPVPAGIEPDALVILHELSDGSVDRVEYTLSVEDGQTFASFVVNEFSDFTLAQVENDMFDAKLEGSTASVTVYGSSGSSIVCAVYDADGRMLSSDTRKLAASWQTLEFNVPSGAERVSFILLDSEYRPVMESIEP